jgi:hypothetical protein
VPLPPAGFNRSCSPRAAFFLRAASRRARIMDALMWCPIDQVWKDHWIGQAQHTQGQVGVRGGGGEGVSVFMGGAGDRVRSSQSCRVLLCLRSGVSAWLTVLAGALPCQVFSSSSFIPLWAGMHEELGLRGRDRADTVVTALHKSGLMQVGDRRQTRG